MADIEKVIKGLECCNNRNDCKQCSYATEYDQNLDCIDKTRADAIELLKGFIKLKEQLEELQIIENSRVKDCDSACDWEARNYHRGRLDAYSIALAHFDQKDGEQE